MLKRKGEKSEMWTICKRGKKDRKEETRERQK